MFNNYSQNNYYNSSNQDLPSAGYYSPRSFERARAGLKSHWISFLTVNIFLFLINVFTGYDYPWHLFPLLSWGIGISIHSAVVKIRATYPIRADREFHVHLAVFLIINGFLFILNILSGFYYPWFIWPMFSWGIGLSCHAFAYHAKKRKMSGNPVSGYYVLWYPGVVCIFLAAVDLFTGNGFGWFLWPSVPIMLIAYIAVDRHANAGYYRNIRHQKMPLANQTTQVSYQRDYHHQNESNQRLIKFCPRCGEPIEPDFLFCEYCGQKLR